MAAWTNVAELYRYLRRTPPTAESAAYAEAQQALEAACGAIEDEAGQRLDQSEDTVTLDGTGAVELVLPRYPVTAVAEVRLLDTDEVLPGGFGGGYTWSQSGVLERLGGVWPCQRRSVRVIYTPGHDPVPIALRRIAWRLVATETENPDGKESEKIGDWQAKWKSDVIAGELTAADRRLISRYAVRE